MSSDSKDSEPLDPETVKGCLKDAGIYENDMSFDDMINYYSVIKNSESTADQENEIRNSLLQSDEHIAESSEEFLLLEESDKETCTNPPVNIINYEDLSRACFKDLPSSNENENYMQSVNHKPKYVKGLDFKSSQYIKLSFIEKVALIYKYHTNLNVKISSAALTSLNAAPRPADIKATANTSLGMNSEINSNDSEIGDLYVSKSGRLTKRKFYTDISDILDEDIFETKKGRKTDEGDWLSKKKSSVDIPKVSGKTSPKKTKSDPQKSRLHNNGNGNHASDKIESCDETLPAASRVKLKLTNSQIMQRSGLFNNMPGRDRRSRAEMMFDNLNKERVEKNKQDQRLHEFEKSLISEEPLSEDITENPNESEPFVKQRITPPSFRKKAHSLDTQIKENVDKVNNPPKKPAKAASKISATTAKKLRNKLLEGDTNDLDTQPGIVSLLNQTLCPICNQQFPDEQIENHAATCGEDPIIRSNSPIITRSSLTRMTCKDCDTVLVGNEEDHICITRERR